jgi:hypothetical protein
MRQAIRSKSRPPRLRPSVLVLEARTVPSFLLVTNVNEFGTGSLRSAINSAVAGDTIAFALPRPSTIQLSGSTLSINHSISIIGPGAGALTIRGTGAVSVFTVNAPTTVSGLTVSNGGGSDGGGFWNNSALTLNNCTITGNNVGAFGGGIINDSASSQLSINRCLISQNTAQLGGGGVELVNGSRATVIATSISGNSVQGTSGTGGGIASGGQLTLIDCSVMNNTVTAASASGTTQGGDALGGAIYSFGTLTVNRCGFETNLATGGSAASGAGGNGFGGGIYINGPNATSTTITDSTFYNNRALGGQSTGNRGGSAAGGAIDWVANAPTTLVNCTIDFNLAQKGHGVIVGATTFGGGIQTDGTGTLQNTIIAGNQSVFGVDPDIAGNVSVASHNLIGDGTGSNITNGSNGNQVGNAAAPLDPKLGLVSNFGGLSPSQQLRPGSPAIDAGSNVGLQLTTDQRGYQRIYNGVVDIGAFEFQPVHYMVVSSDVGQTAEVKLYDTTTGALVFDFNPFEPSFKGGVRVALGDIDGDGIPDLVMVPGGVKVTLVNVNGSLQPSFDQSAGRIPEIKILSGAGGGLYDFLPYDSTLKAGLYVAVADVNGDGRPDVIVAPDATGQSGHTNVRVFYNGHFSTDNDLVAPDREFNAYASGFGGGVRLAAADLNGDGFADIIVAPGIWSGPDIRIFDGKTLANSGTASIIGEFLAYDFRYFGGEFVAAGDVNADGKTDVITGTNGNGGPEVKAFSGAGLLANPSPRVVDDFFAYDPAFNGGARVAVFDVNGDGHADIITGAGPGGTSHVRIFDGGTGSQLQGSTLDSFVAFDVFFTGGVFVGGG